MSILSAQDIFAIQNVRPMITPFVQRSVHKESGASYGLSSCGYDIRVREEGWLDVNKPFKLFSSIELFDIPLWICGIVHDKSSLARQGVAVQNTVLEPGWKGYLTLEISYHGDYRVKIMEGQPIAQILFHQLSSTTNQPYKGKYQNQPPRPVEALREGGE